MTALRTLGAFIAEGVRGRLNGARRARIGLHITDTVGAWIAGAHTPEGQRLLAVSDAGIGNGLCHAVAIHCALARLSEIDNIHLASSITPGGIVVPAAVTIAATQDKSDKDTLLEAIAAGTEVMVRLGLAVNGATILYRGIWPTYFTAACGVAAVAARLYDLDAAQAAHALALALSFASPGVGHHNARSTSRWFALGHAASNGLIAAQAARVGLTSDLNLLDGDFLSRVYGITPDVNVAVAALGDQFAIDSTSIKPWCGARQTIAATHGLLEILDGGTRPEVIAAVEVRIPPSYVRMIDHGLETDNRASYLTSVQFRLALAACDRARLYDVNYSPARLDGGMDAFMAKISVKADEGLLAHYPQAWPAKVIVRTLHGTKERLVISVPGDPQSPFDARQIEDKLSRVLACAAVDSIDSLLACSRTFTQGSLSPTAFISEIRHADAHVSD